MTSTASVYHGLWSSTLIQNSNGLFNNLQSCRSASSVAITYNRSASRNLATRSTLATEAELEHELAKILQERGRTGAQQTSGDNTQNVTSTKLEPYNLTLNRDQTPQEVVQIIENATQVQSQRNKVS